MANRAGNEGPIPRGIIGGGVKRQGQNKALIPMWMILLVSFARHRGRRRVGPGYIQQ